jgi:hypothetical protein
MTTFANNRASFAGLAKAALTRPWTAACPQLVGMGAIAVIGTDVTGGLHRTSLAERLEV